MIRLMLYHLKIIITITITFVSYVCGVFVGPRQARRQTTHAGVQG